MLLEAGIVKEVESTFAVYQGSKYFTSPNSFAEKLLSVLKNHAYIFTYRDTEETYYIQNNTINPAETELKQLTKVALTAMRVDTGTHFYEEVLKFIKIYTYTSRDRIEAWGDIIGFKNNVYLDLNTFQVVKPSITYLRRIIEFLGPLYNKYTRGFALFLQELESTDRDNPSKFRNPWDIISKIDNDHFVEDEEDYTIDEQDGSETVIVVVWRDFYKLMGMLPLRRLPVEFDPDAEAPTWLHFIRTSVPPHFRNTLQRFAGYCLLPTKKYGKFLALLGNGSNGKSTFLTILMELFGEYATSISLQDVVDGRFKIAELEGKLVNIYPDLPKKKIFNTGLFKALITDETPFTIERKFKPPYRAKIMTKFIFGANRLPSVNDDSFAFFRRWLIVNFPKIFDKETADPDLLDRLRQELPGILNWVIAGAYALVHAPRDNPFDYPFTEDEIAERYYRAESPVAAFIQDCIIEDSPDNPEARVKKDELYSLFVKYCKSQGLPTVSQSKFTRDLKKHVSVSLMHLGEPGNRYWAYAGIMVTEACKEGEYEGKVLDDWDEERDIYVPAPLPPEIFRVWPYEPKMFRVKDTISIAGTTWPRGQVVDNFFIHPREVKRLLEEGKIEPYEVMPE